MEKIARELGRELGTSAPHYFRSPLSRSLEQAKQSFSRLLRDLNFLTATRVQRFVLFWQCFFLHSKLVSPPHVSVKE